MSEIFGVASPEDQVKIDRIYAEAAGISQVVNPGHTPESVNARDTTRTPDQIEVDIKHMHEIMDRYDAAVRAATGCPYLTDGKPYWNLRYQLSHYIYEHNKAVKKGN